MNTSKALIAALFGAVTLPAFASVTTFDFSKLAHTTANVNDLLPSELLGSGYWRCTGGDICSSNLDHGLLGGDLKYTINGITATATAQYFSHGQWTTASVMQDHEPAYNLANKIGAGLGVYHVTNDNSDDNITAHEMLTLTFSQPVKLSSIWLRSDGHETNFNVADHFLFNGMSTPLVATLAENINGTVFTFAYGGNHSNQFYLGGVVVSAVPEPSTYGMLLGGLGLITLVRRRKQS